MQRGKFDKSSTKITLLNHSNIVTAQFLQVTGISKCGYDSLKGNYCANIHCSSRVTLCFIYLVTD
jgi:hypothetical protein